MENAKTQHLITALKSLLYFRLFCCCKFLVPMKTKSLLLLSLLCLTTLAFAQKKQPSVKAFSKDEEGEAKKEAATYFKAMNYVQAQALYERLVITDPKDVDYNYKLSLIYMYTNNARPKAMPLMEYVVNANSKSIPKDAMFDLGRAYFYAGLYDKALETYEKYRVEKHGTVDSKLKLELWVKWATDAKELTAHPIEVSFENMGKNINSITADYRPVIGANDSVVYFSSKRKGNTGGLVDDLGDMPSDVYLFTQGDSSRSKAKNIGANINSPFYEECMFVNANADRMLIYKEGPETSGDLFISPVRGKQWDKAVSLGKQFVTKAAETGACFSPDGLTLYFSAEAEGSKTGKDIYRCTRSEQTSWSKPEKLGDNINTKEDEDCPYLWVDGKTLFFSSKGFNSMGGYDIFKAVMNNPAEGFGKAENIGYPLNTVNDDLGIGINPDGKTLYVSTVRDSGIGDYDIYKVTLTQPITPSQYVLLHGVALTNANTPAKGAFVSVTNATSGEEVFKAQTNDANGCFDAALPTGNYKVSLRHAKFGKAEGEIAVNPAEALKLEKIFMFK